MKNEIDKLVIFDLDGTLVDAYLAIQKSLNFTLKKFGCRSVALSTVKKSVGWGDALFIKTFFGDKNAKKALKIYRQRHKKDLLYYSRVIPGAKKVLDVLKKRNYKLAIASNRPGKFTRILLRRLGLKGYFDLVVCAKNTSEIKPKPNLLLRILKKLKIKRASALYMGDMAIDVHAGRNAKIKTMAVLGGSSSFKELKKAKPFKVIPKISDLLNLLP